MLEVLIGISRGGEVTQADFQKLTQKLLDVFLEGYQDIVNRILKDSLNLWDINKFMERMRRIGVDFSQLSGMVGVPGGVNPYQVLGLDKSASDEEVKKRFRDLCFHLHPDTAGYEGTSGILQMVLKAYDLIKIQRGWK
jgi:hypothetical protein